HRREAPDRGDHAALAAARADRPGPDRARPAARPPAAGPRREAGSLLRALPLEHAVDPRRDRVPHQPRRCRAPARRRQARAAREEDGRGAGELWRRRRELRAAGPPVSAEPSIETHFSALAAGAAPAEVTRIVRAYLAAAHAHLEALHRGGASGS